MNPRTLCILILVFVSADICYSQELFLTSEAASSEAKDRKYISVNTDFISNGQSYTPYFGFMYGVSGTLTFMSKMYYSRNASQNFFGDIDIGTNYRFLSDDKKNYHFRMSLLTHIRIPVGRSGTVPKDVNSVISAQYRTDNWGPYAGLAMTLLQNKFAANLQMNYLVTIPKREFKFGNYFMGGLAFGYLLFPREYKGYNDVNLNLYLEPKVYYFSRNKLSSTEYIEDSGGWKTEITAGFQFIFASTSLLEAGYTYSFASDNIKNEKSVVFTTVKLLFF